MTHIRRKDRFYSFVIATTLVCYGCQRTAQESDRDEKPPDAQSIETLLDSFNFRSTDGLLGPIKSAAAVSAGFRESFGDFVETGERGEYSAEFDSEGRLVMKNQFPGETNEWKREFEYDANGNRVKTTDRDASGTITEMFRNHYDSDGMLTRGEIYGSDGEVLSAWTYEYDEFGRKTRVISYNEEAQIKESTVYVHDSLGHLIETRELNGSGSISSFVVLGGYTLRIGLDRLLQAGLTAPIARFKYDDAGRRESAEFLWDTESPGATVEWHRDESGRVLMITAQHGEESSQVECKYDDQGRNTQINADEMSISFSYSQSHQNDWVVATIRRSDGTVLIERKFDQYGNWIEYHGFYKVERFGEMQRVPIFVTRRTLLYHE